MIKNNSTAQIIETTNISTQTITETNPKNLINSYLENIQAKDIEKIKSYLGVLYFLVLTFFSITLLM